MIFRILDIVISAAGLIVLIPLILIITLFGFIDTGSPFFLQTRVGLNQKPFTLIKFRTMKLGVKSVASHLADVNDVTVIGSFLRKTKFDEIPQLINVLLGDMSLVGPRPCLFNQSLLISERNRHNVFLVRPGLTGLAQINGIDMSTPELLAETDARMIETLSVFSYFKYLFMTIAGMGSGDTVGN